MTGPVTAVMRVSISTTFTPDFKVYQTTSLPYSISSSTSTGIIYSIGRSTVTLEEKVKENRLRRTAERRGLRLEKSRRRDPRASDFGGYMLIEVQTKSAFLGSDGFAFSATLDDVDAFLNGTCVHKKPSALERALALGPAVAKGDPAARAEYRALLEEELRRENERIARGGKRQMVITTTDRSKNLKSKKKKAKKENQR